MTRLALTFLVGVFLFVAGGAGDAWAVTFKDGKVSKDNQIEEPAQQVERKSSSGFRGQFFQTQLQKDKNRIALLTDNDLCKTATYFNSDEFQFYWTKSKYAQLSKERAYDLRLSCNVTGSKIKLENFSNEAVCSLAVRIEYGTSQLRWLYKHNETAFFVYVAFARKLRCGVPVSYDKEYFDGGSNEGFKQLSKSMLCKYTTYFNGAKKEAQRRGLTCGVSGAGSTQTASASKAEAKPAVTSAALTAAEKEADRLRNELAALKAQQAETSNKITSDTQVPLITITQSGANGRKGTVKGFAKDNIQIAEVLIDGNAVSVGSDGSFEWSGFVPATGKDIIVEAIDTAALSSTQVIRLERGQIQQARVLQFNELNPMDGKKVVQNDNALALIVGISDYDRTQAPAIFADNDAQFFHDYASLKMGVPEANITTMINTNAEQVDVLLAVKNWLSRAVKQNQSDVYIFFAGHGLASDDGQKMYLLPYDGAPELLDDTAISRERLFSDISSANPRSVTVFLDTCYSGTTRGTDMLIASRPIGIRALEQSIPDNFTVMTAAAGDQTAKPLEEAKHGMFSYFLMKGMEGEADANQDNQITAGELHTYVEQNVVQQSSGSQTPELQGDASRVLVRFQ